MNNNIINHVSSQHVITRTHTTHSRFHSCILNLITFISHLIDHTYITTPHIIQTGTKTLTGLKDERERSRMNRGLSPASREGMRALGFANLCVLSVFVTNEKNKSLRRVC